MRSYALTRYDFDLNIFWTRLLYTLQKKAGDYYTVVQDRKTQLDCMVTLVTAHRDLYRVMVDRALPVLPGCDAV